MHKLLLALLMVTNAVFAAHDPLISEIINKHLKQYSDAEHFSAIQVSIKTGNHLSSYTAGYRAIDSDVAVTMNDLFDIGSITKSFTAVLTIFAENENKIKLEDTLGKYLPQYAHWRDLTLTGLLNMSTGIPNYSNAPKINYLMSIDLKKYWSPAELIALIYSKEFNPPRQSGYFYSNTGYVLIDMILTAQYKMPYSQLLIDKIIKPMGLENTFYPEKNYSTELLQRMVRGYSYNIYDNPELLGRDVTENNLSWAGAAGALVANSEDVVKWVDDLFLNDKLLTIAQKSKMQQVISLATGKPIAHTDKQNPRAFGLGIAQGYDEKFGHYWFYEGQTLGYRAYYMVIPCNKVTLVALFNSATNEDNDHGGALLAALYEHLIKHEDAVVCPSEAVA